MKTSDMYHAIGRVAALIENEIAIHAAYYEKTDRKSEELETDFIETGLYVKLLSVIEQFDALDSSKALETGKELYNFQKENKK